MDNPKMGNSKSEVSFEMGRIPFLSEAVARRKVAKLEQAVGKFRVRTSDALAKLAMSCAGMAELQAQALAAKEAVRGLPPEIREPLERRISEGEARTAAIEPACQVTRPAPETREPELSGGGDTQ